MEQMKKRIRSINQTVAIIKEMDPDTAISYSTIRKAIANEMIPCIFVGNRKLIVVEDVMEYFRINC